MKYYINLLYNHIKCKYKFYFKFVIIDLINQKIVY